MKPGVVGTCAAAAQEAHPQLGAAAFGPDDLDQLDLAGVGDVCAAARRPVEAVHLHDADVFRDLRRLAQREPASSSGETKVGLTPSAASTIALAAASTRASAVRVQVAAVEVDRARLLAQVKRHGLGVADLDECLRQDVLAGVLLHVVEAPRPVQRACDCIRIRGQRR